MQSNLLSYYSDLRLQQRDHEVRDGSRVVRTTTANGESIRLLDIMQFGFLTSSRSTTPSSSRITTDFGVYLAARHFNDRDDVMVHGLSERLAGCDLYVTLEMVDSKVSRLDASRELVLAHSREHSLQTPIPGGIVGAYSSKTTNSLAILSGAYVTPHVGGISTAPYLDDKGIYPTYARTTANAKSKAKGIVKLLLHWEVNRVFCVYERSEFAISLFQKIQGEAAEAGIELLQTNYERRDEESADQAVQKIQDSGLRYVVGIMSTSTSSLLLERAYDRKIAGVSDYQWILPNMGSFSRPSRTFNQDESKFAKALDGAATIDIKTSFDQSFIDVMNSLGDDTILQNDYIDSHSSDKPIFDGYNWTQFSPSSSFLPYTSYDAFMALAISACEADRNFFSPQEHWETLLKTNFKGASGAIAFEPDTAARAFDTTVLMVNNIIIDADSIDEDSLEDIRTFSRLSMTIDFASDPSLRAIEPYVFAQNSTGLPNQLPPLGLVDENKISEEVKLFGWIICGLLLAVSLLLAAYTYRNRGKTLVKKSQPIFLGMMCAGTFILSSAIIPLSLQYDSVGIDADIACMASPWLVVMGFSVAFSAIFTKTWRINRLFNEAAIMNRFEIHAKDVIWPFVLHSTINCVLLSLMTSIAPLEHKRLIIAEYTDRFDRSLENYGACVPSSNLSVALLIVLGVFNFLLIVFANYQCYLGRYIPHNLNEKGSIMFTMVSLLQAVLIGGPMLYFAYDSPTAEFVIKVVLILFTCLAILLPMFLPKILAKDSAEVNVDALNQAIRAHSLRSRNSGTSIRSLSVRTRARIMGKRLSNSAVSEASSTTGSEQLPSSVQELKRRASERRLPSSVQELQRRVSERQLLSPSPTVQEFRRHQSLPSSVTELRTSLRDKATRKSFDSMSLGSSELDLICEEIEESMGNEKR